MILWNGDKAPEALKRVKKNLEQARLDLLILKEELDGVLKSDEECDLSNKRYFINKVLQKIDRAFQDLNMI